MRKIAIFASGSGSNAENIVTYFRDRGSAEVTLILTNKSDAYVLERARRLGVQSHVFSRLEFYETPQIVNLLRASGIDYVVLAGFLWLVPATLLQAFPGRIVNIHPALLPKFGGKGMYGDRVHRAVVEAGETESGITIHRVNEHYDRGDTICQVCVPVIPSDTPATVAEKVHRLEYQYFPAVIESEILKLEA